MRPDERARRSGPPVFSGKGPAGIHLQVLPSWFEPRIERLSMIAYEGEDQGEVWLDDELLGQVFLGWPARRCDTLHVHFLGYTWQVPVVRRS